MSTIEISDIVPLLTVLVSLAAVIIGPFVSLKIAKRQMLSPIRLKWIEELRELISEYLSECEKLIVLGEDGILNKEITDKEVFKKLLYLQQKLKLMLNPHEFKHIELLELIESITDEIHHGVGNLIEFGGKLEGATEISQTILKHEWGRVKRGEI
ncbi:MAG: hypothetical protein M1579_00420 [Gammaproteobacteria bacterium]|nr:hypothetical protein [Gammaproteobacteria bacterium]